MIIHYIKLYNKYICFIDVTSKEIGTFISAIYSVQSYFFNLEFANLYLSGLVTLCISFKNDKKPIKLIIFKINTIYVKNYKKSYFKCVQNWFYLKVHIKSIYVQYILVTHDIYIYPYYYMVENSVCLNSLILETASQNSKIIVVFDRAIFEDGFKVFNIMLPSMEATLHFFIYL